MVTATGGIAPYTILWSNTDSGATADSLCAGIYMVTVLDSNNCMSQDSVLMTEPSILTANIIDSSATCEPLCNGSAESSPTGGTGPYNYLWLNGDTLAIADSLCSGIQQLMLIDANGCTVMDSVRIIGDSMPPIADAASAAVAAAVTPPRLPAWPWLHHSGRRTPSWDPACHRTRYRNQAPPRRSTWGPLPRAFRWS